MGYPKINPLTGRLEIPKPENAPTVQFDGTEPQSELPEILAPKPKVSLSTGGRIRQLFDGVIFSMAQGMGAAAQHDTAAQSKTAAFAGAMMGPQVQEERDLKLRQAAEQTEMNKARIAEIRQKSEMVTLPNGAQVPFPIAVKLFPEYVKQQGAMAKQNDQQEHVTGEKAKDREQKERLTKTNQAFKEKLFEKSERGKNARASAIRAGILRPLTDAGGNITGLFNNRTGTVEPFTQGEYRTGGLAGGELNRRGMLAGMVQDVDLLETLGEANRDSIGPMDGRVEGLKQITFGSDEDKVQMFRISDNLKDQLLRARSGAQINEAEYSRLSRLLPDPRLPESTFFARLNDFRREMKRLSLLTAAPTAPAADDFGFKPIKK